MSEALDVIKHGLITIHEALCMNSYEMRGSFTCDEAEAMHATYIAAGLDNMAEQFMLAHAHSDDDGDQHRVVDNGPDRLPTWRYATDEERDD